MSEVLAAYERLTDTAGRGNLYTVDQVFLPPYRGFGQADTIFGNGFDIERTIMVPDIVEDGTVEATVKLRVIKTAADELYLRTWLIWTPSDGAEHKSYASYEIGRDAAERLAATAVAPVSPTSDLTEEQLMQMPLGQAMNLAMSAMFEALGDAEPYRAQWLQTIPGEDLDFDDEGSYDFAERHYNYHENVINGLGGTESPATCMLTYVEIGEVGPQEIVVIEQFVADELEVSVLV